MDLSCSCANYLAMMLLLMCIATELNHMGKARQLLLTAFLDPRMWLKFTFYEFNPSAIESDMQNTLMIAHTLRVALCLIRMVARVHPKHAFQ